MNIFDFLSVDLIWMNPPNGAGGSTGIRGRLVTAAARMQDSSFRPKRERAITRLGEDAERYLPGRARPGLETASKIGDLSLATYSCHKPASSYQRN
jgi:hypothetical protein